VHKTHLPTTSRNNQLLKHIKNFCLLFLPKRYFL